MRRFVLAGIVATLAGVLAGCPSPPPTYQAPTVESIQLSPSPAHPGETFTVLIEARDDIAVSSGSPNLVTTPNGTRLTATALACTSALAPQENQRHVLITVNCTVPTLALNGGWSLQIHVSDGSENAPPGWSPPDGTDVTVPFGVVGGSDDHSPPQLLRYEITPSVVDQTTTFTVNMRLRDDTLPPTGTVTVSDEFDFSKLFAPNSQIACTELTHTPASATEVDVAATCRPSDYGVPGRAEAGLHRAPVSVRDALDNVGSVEMFVDVLG